MGVVYKAYDPKLERAVALKLIQTKNSAITVSNQYSERLLREAVVLARLAHPNIVGIFDVGRVADGLFMAMEYIEGQNLRQWLADTKPPWPNILSVFVEAGRGLLAAHEAGIVHRDFKLDNVIIGLDKRVRVLDFGLACASEESLPAPPDSDVVKITRDTNQPKEGLSDRICG
jgi:serine/threonine-protein kinase